MEKRVAIAKYIESSLALGRSYIQALASLDYNELEIVITDFLGRSGTQYVVKLRQRVTADKVDTIKLVREITDCSLLHAKNFIEGSGELTVTDQQKNELGRVFLTNLVVNGA